MWNGKNQTEYKPIKRVLLKHPKDAYRNQANADANWKDLGYPAPVSYDKVTKEFEAFVSILEKFIPTISYLPEADGTGLDSLYTHDPIVPTNKGIIMMNMGKIANDIRLMASGPRCGLRARARIHGSLYEGD